MVTPVWRYAVWYPSIKWQFRDNDMFLKKMDGYQTRSAHIEKLRYLTPDSVAHAMLLCWYDVRWCAWSKDCTDVA